MTKELVRWKHFERLELVLGGTVDALAPERRNKLEELKLIMSQPSTQVAERHLKVISSPHVADIDVTTTVMHTFHVAKE